MPETFSDFFPANLAALRPWSPVVADILAATPVPPDWQPTLGTDGTPTFARRTPQRIDWLGGTSMPASSAAPLCATMNVQAGADGGTANGLGLGIGSAYEWRALSTRLAASQMLFILDDDSVALRLALAICDLSAILALGRIVLLLEPPTAAIPSASDQLLAFLATHSGFEPPTVLHPLATLAPARRNALIAVGEAMVRRVVQRRSEDTVTLANALIATPPAPVRGAILGLPFLQRSVWESSLPMALAEITKRPIRVLALDRHDSCSPLARLEALQTQRPESLWSDLFRGQLNLPLPPAVSVLTWVPPNAGIGYWQAERFPDPATLPPQDQVIIHSYAHQRLLLKYHFPPTQCTVLPPAVAPIATPPHPHATSSIAFPSTIALIADLPSLDPEVYGLTLPSHVAVWQALRDLITEAPLPELLSLHPDKVPDLLRRGQARAGVTIDDPGLRESLARGLEHVVLPATAVIGLARQLHDAGLPLKIIGRNVPREDLPRATFADIPDVGQLADAFAGVAVALHFAPDATIHPLYLWAPLFHVPLVSPEHPWDRHPATLPQMLEVNTEILCPAANQLIPTLKALLRNAPKRQALADAAAAQIATAHTWRQRVASLLVPRL